MYYGYYGFRPYVSVGKKLANAKEFVAKKLKGKANPITIEGKRITIKADGLLARVLQHELDHLDGISIISKAEPVPPDTQDAESI